MKSKPWLIAYSISLGLSLESGFQLQAYADNEPVLDNYLRARDDLRYQVSSLQRSYNDLSKAVERGRKTIKNTAFSQDDKKKTRAEIVEAIYELQRRLQALDTDNTYEKKDMYAANTDQVELEENLNEVGKRLIQTKKSLDEVERMIKDAK